MVVGGTATGWGAGTTVTGTVTAGAVTVMVVGAGHLRVTINATKTIAASPAIRVTTVVTVPSQSLLLVGGGVRGVGGTGGRGAGGGRGATGRTSGTTSGLTGGGGGGGGTRGRAGGDAGRGGSAVGRAGDEGGRFAISGLLILNSGLAGTTGVPPIIPDILKSDGSLVDHAFGPSGVDDGDV